MSRDWLLPRFGRRELGVVLAATRHALEQLAPQLEALTADAAAAERRQQQAIAAGLRVCRDHVADVIEALEALRMSKIPTLHQRL